MATPSAPPGPWDAWHQAPWTRTCTVSSGGLELAPRLQWEGLCPLSPCLEVLDSRDVASLAGSEQLVEHLSPLRVCFIYCPVLRSLVTAGARTNASSPRCLPPVPPGTGAALELGPFSRGWQWGLSAWGSFFSMIVFFFCDLLWVLFKACFGNMFTDYYFKDSQLGSLYLFCFIHTCILQITQRNSARFIKSEGKEPRRGTICTQK